MNFYSWFDYRYNPSFLLRTLILQVHSSQSAFNYWRHNGAVHRVLHTLRSRDYILDIRDYSLPALLQVYYTGYSELYPPCSATGILYWIFRNIATLLCYRYPIQILDIQDYILPALQQVYYTRYWGLYPPCSATGILYWIFRNIASLLCYRYHIQILDIRDYIFPALLQVYYTGYLGLYLPCSVLCYRYTILDIWGYIPPALELVSYTGYSGL